MSVTQGEEFLLAKSMGLNQGDIDHRLRLVDFREEDQARVQALSGLVDKHKEEMADAFFQHLKAYGEAAGLLGDARLLQEARRLKIAHLTAMTKGSYGVDYAIERLSLGLIYAKAGLKNKVFLGAFHHMMRLVGFKVLESASEKDSLLAFDRFMALKKIAFFDISLIVDVIVYERERVIGLQQKAIQELSTPVLVVKDRVLVLPIIGVVNTDRAKLMTQTLLEAIRSHRAAAVVIDITGVPVVDTNVARHLAEMVTTARLMGAATVVTGVSAEVARAMVSLGVDCSGLETAADLRSGLEWVEHLAGPAHGA